MLELARRATTLAAIADVVGPPPPLHIRLVVGKLYSVNLAKVRLSLGEEEFSMQCEGLPRCTDVSLLPEPGSVSGSIYIELPRPLVSGFLFSLALLAEGLHSKQGRD